MIATEYHHTNKRNGDNLFKDKHFRVIKILRKSKKGANNLFTNDKKKRLTKRAL